MNRSTPVDWTVTQKYPLGCRQFNQRGIFTTNKNSITNHVMITVTDFKQSINQTTLDCLRNTVIKQRPGDPANQRRVYQSRILPFQSTAVHVILSISASSLLLLCFLFLCKGIPKAGWETRKRRSSKGVRTRGKVFNYMNCCTQKL